MGSKAERSAFMLDLHLVVSDRYDVPQRVVTTCCRRQGAVLALTFDRGGPDGTATLDLTVDVEPRLQRGLIDRISALVDVLETRPSTVPRRLPPEKLVVVCP